MRSEVKRTFQVVMVCKFEDLLFAKHSQQPPAENGTVSSRLLITAT